MTARKSTKKPQTESTTDAELDAFARHLSEALRIARPHPSLSARLYNSLGKAWNNYIGMESSLTEILEGEEGIRLALRLRRDNQKGGAK